MQIRSKDNTMNNELIRFLTAEIDGLLSVQFVKKVIDLVESKDYTYQVDTKQ